MSAIFVTRQDLDRQSSSDTCTSSSSSDLNHSQLWKVFELSNSLVDDLSLSSLRQNLESMEHFDLLNDDMAMDFLQGDLNEKTYVPDMMHLDSDVGVDRYEDVHDVVIEALKENNLEIARKEGESISKELAMMMQDDESSSASSSRPNTPKAHSKTITVTKLEQQPVSEFLLFPQLPKELRLLIWRFSFPQPRIITCRHQLGIPLGGPKYIYLYPAGPFHAPPSRSQSHHQMVGTPNLPNPVTLSICAESRAETMRYYVPATHLHVPSRTTYFSPSRDVLHLEFGDLYSDAVFAAYGPQLDQFRAILLHMWQWCAPFPGAFYIHTSPTHPTRFIAKLRGLREVLLRPRFVEVPAGDGEDDVPDTEELKKDAEAIREEYWKERVLHGDWTVDVVRVVGREGEVY